MRALLLTLFLSCCAIAEAQTTRLSLTPLVSGLTQPVLLTNAKDGSNRRFIVEQPGRIRVLQPGATVPTLFLDITSRVLYGGERGLLGLAFHPQFSSNRRFYVNYTRQRDGATVVAEYRDGAEQRILFTIPQPYENHNGGMIEFGTDGYLYVGMGDGGAGNDPQNRAQNLNELLGKMLRINVDVPNSTPEIFAYGFRNPWRFSFDRLTGQLYAGDVGQGAREEVDIVTRGGNYGWRVWEGSFCTGLGPASCSAPGFIPPIADYVNTGPDGRCAIIGGYVYRGAQGSLPYGAYIYGDLCSGEIFMLKDGAQSVLLATPLQISSFGEDESGELYVLNINGSISRLTNPDAVIASQRPYAIADAPFVESTAGAAANQTRGYVRIQPNPEQPVPSGMAIFGVQQRGVLTSEASVPISRPITAGRVYAEVSANVNTGIALANPNDQAATVAFYFTDANGTRSRDGTTTLAPRQQIAVFLTEAPFNAGSPLLGAFTFTSSIPIAAVALRGFTNERGDFLITTLPVAEPGAAASGNSTIAHFADGGGWTTQVVLVNPFDSAISGNIQFHDRSGIRIRTVGYSIPSQSSTRIVTGGLIEEIQTGSVRIESSGTASPYAFAIFSFKTGGVIVTEAGVPASPAGSFFQTYVESSGAIRSGIAIANPTPAAVNVSLEIAGLTSVLSLPANGQTAMFLNEIPGFSGLPSTVQGVLRITSDAAVAVTGLRGHTNGRGEFLITSTPPAADLPDNAASESFFPHFVDGGGYRVQFVLFGRSTSGTMYFLDSSGNPAPLQFQ